MKQFLEEQFHLFSLILYVLLLSYELGVSYNDFINTNLLNSDNAYLFYYQWIANSFWITLAYFIYLVGYIMIYLFRFKLVYFLSFVHLSVVVFILAIKTGYFDPFHDNYVGLLSNWLTWIFVINVFLSFLMKMPFDKVYDDSEILDVLE